MKTYKYRIYPNKTQVKLLDGILSVCQRLYNICLRQRIDAYKDKGESISAFTQINQTKVLATENDLDLSIAHSQTIQDVVLRLDNSFKSFFRRCKAGEKPGFPRFKSLDRFRSFTYPQASAFGVRESNIRLSKVGVVKLVKHRPLPEGALKTCTVKKDAIGRWFVCLVVDTPPPPSPKEQSPDDLVVGMDLGCEKFCVLSDGTKVEHPRYYRASQEKLAKAQRRYEKVKYLPKGNPTKARRKHAMLKVHTKVNDQRNDFLHKLSRTLVNIYDTLYIEDLDIKRMTEDNYRSLNKSILDSGWGGFKEMLTYKAEDAGKRVIPVNPAYSSQICSGCGVMVRKGLSVRVHECPSCSLRIDRDLNAAINIKSFGTKLCGLTPTRSP